MSDFKIIKDNLFPTPPLFSSIQTATAMDWSEMYQVFNMGHRMELYVPSQSVADQIISISQSFGVEAKVVGRVEEGKGLEIRSAHGAFTY